MQFINIVARWVVAKLIYEMSWYLKSYWIVWIPFVSFKFLYAHFYRWPGSVHVSTIFDNSLLRAQFENNEFGNSVLVGDGG